VPRVGLVQIGQIQACALEEKRRVGTLVRELLAQQRLPGFQVGRRVSSVDAVSLRPKVPKGRAHPYDRQTIRPAPPKIRAMAPNSAPRETALQSRPQLPSLAVWPHRRLPVLLLVLGNLCACLIDGNI
jgi:hypothetical protein